MPFLVLKKKYILIQMIENHFWAKSRKNGLGFAFPNCEQVLVQAAAGRLHTVA